MCFCKEKFKVGMKVKWNQVPVKYEDDITTNFKALYKLESVYTICKIKHNAGDDYTNNAHHPWKSSCFVYFKEKNGKSGWGTIELDIIPTKKLVLNLP